MMIPVVPDSVLYPISTRLGLDHVHDCLACCGEHSRKFRKTLLPSVVPVNVVIT